MGTAELVHPVDVAEAEGWVRTFMTTLLLDPHSPGFDKRLDARRRDWRAERIWGARDRGRWVATLATMQRTITVPGAGTGTLDLTADALTMVTVAGTHRRQGLLTRMLADSLRTAKERGDALSVLVAAEWPIYGRFGYAPATVSADYRLLVGRRGAVPGPADPSTVRQVEPDELAGIVPGVFDAARRLRPGQIDRCDRWWSRQLGQDDYPILDDHAANHFVHDGPDGPDGTVSWKTTRGFEVTGPMGEVEITDLIATTDAAYRDLWAYVAGLDALEAITVHNRPVDEPVRWLLPDGRTLKQTAAYDFMWLRLLDVPAALSARRYAVPGDVVLEVTDDDSGAYARGRYRLHSSTEGAECRSTDAEPDLRISQRTLASIYLGGHRLSQRAILADVDELTPGAGAVVDLMFSTPVPPWTQTGF